MNKRTSASAKIADTFLRAAMGPLAFAATQVGGNRIQAGMDEVAPAALVESFQRGVADVARLAGVSAADVERTLPIPERDAIAARLVASHPAAVASFKLHAGQLGFFDAVTALTVDGRQPDIAIQLERVASKLRREKGLAAPLGALAADLAAWIALVEQSSDALRRGSWLADALRRRRIRATILAIVPIVLLVATTSAIVWISLRRDAIDERLGGADPCVVETLAPGELSLASNAQEERVAGLRQACGAQRTAEAARLADEKRRAEEARLLEERRAARAAACATIGRSVAEKKPLDDAARAEAGAAAGLVERLTRRALEPADVGPADPPFPCRDTPHHAALEAAFGDALLQNVSVWTVLGDPSPFVHATLVSRADAIPERARLGVADNAERTAKRGLTRGQPDVLARAKRLCVLARALGVPGKSACEAVEAR